MYITTYIKAHIFNSTNSAFNLAQKNEKNISFAEKMILKKINRIMTSHENIYPLAKMEKYNDLLAKLDLMHERSSGYWNLNKQEHHNSVSERDALPHDYNSAEEKEILQKKRICIDS